MVVATMETVGDKPVERFDPVASYAEQVVTGDIIAGELVRLQCQRHLDDLENGHERGLSWDIDAAIKPIVWIGQNIEFIEGGFAGKPFILDEHQAFIVGSLFGWKKENGFRRYKTAYIEIGKGNGKSPLLAALGLYCLLEDDEPKAQILSAASSRGQARVIFDDAIEFAKNSPISNRLAVYEHFIRSKADRSEFKPVSSEAGTLSGPRPSVAFVDELHEHKNDGVVKTLKAGFKHRRNPLMVIITNSGADLKTTCGRWHVRVVNVLRNIFQDDSLFGYITTLDKGDDYTDPKVWKKTNPLIGNGYNEEYLKEQVNDSIQMPSQKAGVLRLNFCQWTQQGETWLDYEKWNKLAKPRAEWKLIQAAWGRSVDLSTVSDFTCVLNGFPDEDGKLYIKPRFYLPEDSLADREDPELIVDLMRWSKTGLLDPGDENFEPWLNLMPGGVIDTRIIKKAIKDDSKKYGGVKVPYDPYRMEQIRLELDEETSLETVKYGQSYSNMNEPCKWLETAIYNGNILHDGNPLMNWMIANAVVEENGLGHVRPSKKKSNAKIDGVSALLMMIGGWIFPLPEDDKMSGYNSAGHGIRRLS